MNTTLDPFYVEDDDPEEVRRFQHVLDICNPHSCEYCRQGVPRDQRPQTTRKPD